MNTRRRLLNKTVSRVQFTNVTSFSFTQSSSAPTINFSVLITYSDSSSETKQSSAITYLMGYYANSTCTVMADLKWFNTPGTYYAKAHVTVDNQKYETMNYLTITIKSPNKIVVDYQWTISTLNEIIYNNGSSVAMDFYSDVLLKKYDDGSSEYEHEFNFGKNLWVCEIDPRYYDDYAYSYGYDFPTPNMMTNSYGLMEIYLSDKMTRREGYYFIRYYVDPGRPEEVLNGGNSQLSSSTLIPCEVLDTGSGRATWRPRTNTGDTNKKS